MQAKNAAAKSRMTAMVLGIPAMAVTPVSRER
jgi:hypothetical protein